MKILFAHLLNNYTGSPKVLSVLLNEISKESGYTAVLLTSKTSGALSNIPGIEYHDNFYRWHENKFLRIFQFALSQIRIFLFALFKNYDVLYMNTVVPFGAALAANLRGKKIIYHIHEVYVNPGFVKRLYSKVMKKCASRAVCVSKYVQDNVSFEKSTVVYNPVASSPVPLDLDNYLKNKFEKKIVFMPTSLKEYKGVFQFVELAKMNPAFNFVLLCSTELSQMEKFFEKTELPENLTLIGQQKSLEKFYREAMITMHLSLYDKCIETFGLTVLESFDALVPAVAPDYGGPKEIIENEKNGYLVNPYDLEFISECLKKITVSFDVYKSFAMSAGERAKKISKDSFIKSIKKIIDDQIEGDEK